MSNDSVFTKEYPVMYILVKEDIPLGLAMAAVGHAAVAAYIKFGQSDSISQNVIDWLSGPFRKIVCKVTQEEFDRAKGIGVPHVVMTELALDKEETAIAFIPSREFPKFFRFLKLYK